MNKSIFCRLGSGINLPSYGESWRYLYTRRLPLVRAGAGAAGARARGEGEGGLQGAPPSGMISSPDSIRGEFRAVPELGSQKQPYTFIFLS